MVEIHTKIKVRLLGSYLKSYFIADTTIEQIDMLLKKANALNKQQEKLLKFPKISQKAKLDLTHVYSSYVPVLKDVRSNI